MRKIYSIKEGKKRGFTLIEVMIVLSIVAMMGVIVMPNLMNVRDNAKLKVDKQVCEGIKRTILYLMADEVASFDSTLASFKYDPESKTLTDEVGVISGTDELKAALQDVKKPQIDTDASYVIEIKGNKTVEVQVDNQRETSTEK